MLIGGFGKLEAAIVSAGDAYDYPNWLIATYVNL